MDYGKSRAAKVAGIVTELFAACFAVSLLLVLGGLATGRLNGERFGAALAALRGETRGEESAAMTPELEMPREAEALEAVKRARTEQEELLGKLSLETERKQIELDAIRRDGRRATQEMERKQKEFEEARARLERERSEWTETLASDGLRKVKEALEEMDAAKAAELLYEHDLTTTVQLLGSMRRHERATILEAIITLDRRKGLTETTGRAGQIMRMLTNPVAGAES